MKLRAWINAARRGWYRGRVMVNATNELVELHEKAWRLGMALLERENDGLEWTEKERLEVHHFLCEVARAAMRSGALTLSRQN